MKPDFSVEGRRVLITGGAGGIGMALAQAFVDSNSEVTVTDLGERPATLNEKIHYAKLDVTSDTEMEALAADINAIDVVIHCAGRLIRWKEYEIDTFKNILDIHLIGALRLANAFDRHLKASGYGSIILVGSMFSYFGAPHLPAYTAAKTAVTGLTRSLALRYAQDNVRVNCIAPGWIATEISKTGRTDTAFNDRLMARLPTKRWSEAEELAGTVVFLASKASALINGAVIPVDGGYTAA